MAQTPDLTVLVPSWELTLRAERKSPLTITSYITGVQQYLAWCRDHGAPLVIDRRQVARFTDHVLERAQPATAMARQRAVRRFAAWLVAEDELASDPLLGMTPPKLDTRVIEPLSETEIKAMLKACAGADFRDRRDEALVRLMCETGVRAGEVAALQLADVNLLAGSAIVRRGKGGKGRTIPFGPQTARAIDRYIRTRRGHRLAASPDLWLGDRSRTFGYDGLHRSLKLRAAAAGIKGFHPHKLRHTAAHRWLAAGGSEGGLMAVAGWTRPEMLMRYTQAEASSRAAEEARKLDLGDV